MAAETKETLCVKIKKLWCKNGYKIKTTHLLFETGHIFLKSTEMLSVKHPPRNSLLQQCCWTSLSLQSHVEKVFKALTRIGFRSSPGGFFQFAASGFYCLKSLKLGLSSKINLNLLLVLKSPKSDGWISVFKRFSYQKGTELCKFEMSRSLDLSV